MKNKLLGIAVVLVATILFSCKKETGPAGATGPTGATGPVLSGNLKGYVNHYDIAGSKITTGLGGDSIFIDGTTQFAVTDANGMYLFNNLTTGTYNFTIRKAGFGSTKIQGLEFAGGGDVYRNVNISMIPSNNVSAFTLKDTIINSQNQIRIKGSAPSSASGQTIIIYIGAPGSTTVNSGTTNQINYITINMNPGATSFFKSFPTTDLYDLGYASGNTAYCAAYTIGGNLNASSYIDYSNDRSVFTALGNTPLFANVLVQ